jgi:hypothetical protein
MLNSQIPRGNEEAARSARSVSVVVDLGCKAKRLDEKI